jgi:hypothetical protein
MLHTVTITHVVEADTWDGAVEKVLRNPITHVVDCRVKTPGKQLLHVMASVFREAYERLQLTA